MIGEKVDISSRHDSSKMQRDQSEEHDLLNDDQKGQKFSDSKVKSASD